MAGYKLIEAVKKNAGIKSDNELALRLGISRQNISTWKNQPSKPDTETTINLMILGEIKPKDAKVLLNSGFASILILILVGAFSVISWIAHQFCILCKIAFINKLSIE